MKHLSCLAGILFGFLPFLGGAPIPGLFNTGVMNDGTLVVSGLVDPHWTLVQSADGAFPGPAARVLNDSGFPIPPWLANGTTSKWIAPQANQSTGNQPGNYTYRLTFNLTGLDPETAVITGAWTSDNVGPEVRLNGAITGFASDGNFGALGNAFTINAGFVEGTNTLEFVVNNATGVPPAVNPTGFRAELSGTAESLAPPGTPPSIQTQPTNQTVFSGNGAFFTVAVYASRPVTYQWLRNSTPIPGATNTTFTLQCATEADAGAYQFVASNSFGMASSVVVMLAVTVNPDPFNLHQRTDEPPGPASRRTGLAFSEIMYHPPNRADGRELEFVELYNSNPFFENIGGWRITGEWDYTFPSNTMIPGNSFIVIAPAPADVEAVYGLNGVFGGFTNKLNNSFGTLRLLKRSGGVVLELTYSDQPPWPPAADGTGHSLVLSRPSLGQANPAAWAASALKGGSPRGRDPAPNGALEQIVINEFLAHTDLPAVDFIELYNPGGVPVDISGSWLSDDPITNKFRVPDGIVLEPHGLIAFDQDQLGFALQADGETIYLVSSNRARVIDAVRFSGQVNGVATGRHPDGAPGFQELSAPTRGATNAPPLLRDIVINEIMYHPLSEESDDEYVELYNRGAATVNLSGWRFLDGINYTFPPNTILPAGGYLVVAANLTRFMSNYPAIPPGQIVGNFSGQLADGGERIALARPETAFITNGQVIATNLFYVVVDEVTYAAGGRWGKWADGGGSSLELIDSRSDNRLGAGWADSDHVSPAQWTTVEATGVLDLGSGTADKLDLMLLGEGEALVDNVEVIVAGQNRVTNSVFEAGVAGWIFEGNHVTSGGETGDGYLSSRSLHLRATDRGDLAANHARTTLSSAVASGATATLRAKVRWLRGHPEILLRLKGNWLEAFGRLSVPVDLGTPGAANRRAQPNVGPAITEVTHHPVLPTAFEAIRVVARVTDPDGVQNVRLYYRIDPSVTSLSIPMTDDGQGCDASAGDGIFSGSIPGQANDKLIAFRIQATDRSAPAAITQFPHDAPARECLVRVGETPSTNAFGSYRLWLTAATVATWSAREKLSNEKLDGTFVSGTNRVIYNVGTHYSGSSYTSPGYNSPVGNLCGYDIFFPKDDPFLGETHMVLDWPVRDTTDQREQLMFWFLDQFGLPNMYRRYVVMWVNGVRRGAIYDDVQQPSGETVEEWFTNPGTLLKTDCWDEFNDAGDRETSCLALNALQVFTTTGGVKKPARYRWVWRPRATGGTVNDFTDLFELIDAANAPTNSYQPAVECVADIEHWMRTFAANDLASYWDAFGNPNAKNTYLYKPRGDRWKLLCWDFDVGLGASTVSVAAESPTAELFPSLNDPGMNRLYSIPAFVRLYWNAIDEAVNGFFRSGPGTPVNAILTAKYDAFQANGISLVSPFVDSGGGGGAPSRTIPDWITQRRDFLLLQLAPLASNFALTSPTTITTNRNLVSLAGVAPVRVRSLLVNGIPYPVTWTSVTAWRILVPVRNGTTNLVVTALDRFGQAVAGATATVSVTYNSGDESAENNVIINEIMYHSILPEATYLELFNRSTQYTFDLSGWRLNGVDYTFPPGSFILPGQYLVLAKNLGAFGSAYGFHIPIFGKFDGQLDDGGETLTLLRPMGTNEVAVDRVTYDDDPPWSAVPDGRGAALQLIDSAQDNDRVSNWSDGSAWRYFSYTGPVGGSSLTRLSLFFEAAGGDVYIDDISLVFGSVPEAGVNALSNGGFESALSPPWMLGPLAVTNTAITPDSPHSGHACLHLVINPGTPALTTFYQDFPALMATTNYTVSFWFRSGTNGTNLTLRLNTAFRPTLNPVAIRFTPGAQNSSPASLPPYPPVWLSEVQPINLDGITDNFGEREPWIEIHNSGASQLSLDNFHLADNYSNLAQWPFPPGTVINSGEYLLVWADGEPVETAAGNLHASFRLNETNGTVVLSRSLGGTLQILDYINYARVGTNRSWGAFPPGQGSLRQEFFFPTPRATNDPSFPPRPLFINEWMAANQDFLPDPADADYDDWFEIYNPGTNRAEIAGFKLTDNPANPNKFTVPPGISVPAGGFLLVWADEDVGQTRVDGDLHTNFKLNSTVQEIRLYAPDGKLVDAIDFQRQTNNISQGRWPDGAPGPFPFMLIPTPRAPNVVSSSPDPAPVVTSILAEPGRVVLTWSSVAGRSYVVEYKLHLDDASWTPLPAAPPAVGSQSSQADTSINEVPQRFYRVLLLP